MDNSMDNSKDVSFAAFEAELVRAEMRDKRKDRIIALLAIIILLSNLAWLLFLNQFDLKTNAVMFDTTEGGDNSYIGNDGEINNGTDGSNNDNGDAQGEAEE